MKLKASHYWAQDGRVIVEVRDHDAKIPMPAANQFSGFTSTQRSMTRIASLVHTMIFPRGTTKAAVKLAKKNAIMLYEMKVNEVSR